MNLDTITSLVPTAAACKDMAAWSETKKTEFVATFERRSAASRLILETTASCVLEIASRRKFVSVKHANQVERVSTVDPRWNGHQEKTGRSYEDIYKVARAQAEAILKGLPPLKKAVQIIDPDTAEKIDARDKLLAKGRKIRDELVELAEPVRMVDLDQNMTVGEFRKLIKDRERKQKRLVNQLDELAKDGNELENSINKALYAGLPGLSDAVIKVVNNCYERSSALDAATRRVAERVKFGDSAAAMDILRRFEDDEVEVSDEIKAEFDKALKKFCRRAR